MVGSANACAWVRQNIFRTNLKLRNLRESRKSHSVKFNKQNTCFYLEYKGPFIYEGDIISVHLLDYNVILGLQHCL